MFKRIDLYRSHCESLRLVIHTPLPSDLADNIFSSSHFHSDDSTGEDEVVFYGSRYRSNKNPHIIQANVVKLEDGKYHLGINYSAEDLTAPPEDMKPVRVLADYLSEFNGDVEFRCTGTYVYSEQDKWTSSIPLPIELPRKLKTFTHMESLTFSERENDIVTKSLGIRLTTQGDIRHTSYARFKSRFETEIPSQALKVTRQLSRQFIRQTKGE